MSNSNEEKPAKSRKKSSSDMSERSSSRGSEKSRSFTETRSKGSSDSSVVTKGRKKKKASEAGSVHRVTFTVTIAKAVPTVEEEEAQEPKEGTKKKRLMEAPKAHGYFHYEYNLLPDDDETVKTDVVTFGVAAKIYTDRQEPKVLRTWQDGEQTWVAWTHCHTVTMTDRLLMKLYDHSVNLHVWDHKDKMSSRARFDRPKAFRLPQSKPGEQQDAPGSGVKALVTKQVNAYRKLQPKKCQFQRPLPGLSESGSRSGSAQQTDMMNESNQGEKHSDLVDPLKNVKLPSQATTMMSTLIQEQKEQVFSKKTGVPMRTYSRLGRIAGMKGALEEENVSVPAPNQKPGVSPAGSANSRRAGRTSTSAGSRSSVRKTSVMPSQKLNETLATLVEKEEDAEDGLTPKPAESPNRQSVMKSDTGTADILKKTGVCSMSLKLSKLFAGLQNLTERLFEPVAGIEDMFMSVAINGPLMSEEQRQALNPLVVTVHSATNMPSTPLSYAQLSERCSPVYLQYTPYIGHVNRSMSQPHAADIYWDDISVMLAGLMEPAQLRECLQGVPLEIEVHDRDSVVVTEEVKPSLFGDDMHDEKISNVGIISSKQTRNSAFQDGSQPWHPYGIAKFDLSDLLVGQRVLHLTSPIMPCPLPDILGGLQKENEGKSTTSLGAVDGTVKSAMPAGHYVDSGASMKIRVALTYPLRKLNDPVPHKEMYESKCPFSRIVFKFDYRNVAFLHELHTLLLDINARALELHNLPAHVIQAALSTYKLSLEQQNSACLDIVTGFQVLDKQMHLFVLEGLSSQAIDHLWKSLPVPENSDIKVLYNSEFCFSRRLYGSLDVDLCRIKLHEPLSVVVQQALLYVRDMVPPPCFQAISKLDMLLKTVRLRDAVKNDLFPSAEMIVSLSKEFGVPMTAEDFEELNPVVEVTPSEEEEVGEDDTSKKTWIPMDNSNEAYEIQLQQRGEEVHDFDKENRDSIRRQSELNAEIKSRTMPEKVYADSPFMYSSQRFSSVAMSKEKLRGILVQNTNKRYTYSLKFHHSMTVPSVDAENVAKKMEKESRHQWRVSRGWSYPGPRSSKDSNRHPLLPHESRLEELQTAWTENTLHAVDRPTLDWRGPFTGSDWKQDLHLVSSSALGVSSFQRSIHLPGELRRREKLAAQQREYDEWKAKLIVDQVRAENHRCSIRAELHPKGRWASSQTSKLHGLLKDEPQKYSLRKPGFVLAPIPPLDVVRQSGPASTAPVKGFVPGPYLHRDCMPDNNHIPSYDYQHKDFIKMKGQDFNVLHKDRSKVYKRRINPLQEGERGNRPVDDDVMAVYTSADAVQMAYNNHNCTPATQAVAAL